MPGKPWRLRARKDFRIIIIELDAGELLLCTQREQIGFIGAGTVQTPGAVGQGLGELHFENAFGLEIIEKALAKARICYEIMLRRHDGLAAEGMPHGIEARDVFAGGSARAGGAGRVLAIDRGAVEGRFVSVTHSGVSMARGTSAACRYFGDVVERQGRSS